MNDALRTASTLPPSSESRRLDNADYMLRAAHEAMRNAESELELLASATASPKMQRLLRDVAANLAAARGGR